MKKIVLVSATLLLLISSCKEKKIVKTIVKNKNVTQIEKAKVSDAWIINRVEKTKQKFNNFGAGKVIWNAMEAHGGLQKWYENGPISFRFNYQPIDGSVQRDTYQAIDTWRSKARHYLTGDSTSQFGWDGKNAWLIAKDSSTFKYNTRFWSLTPYFFAGLPFVLDGNGVNLELQQQKTFNGRLKDVVKVTFDEGTGDSPNDYYVLYFDNITHKMNVIRYIVSYPGYFKNGNHLPEKLMELFEEQIVDCIVFPKTYKTYWLTENENSGEHITDIKLSDIKFLPNLEKNHFKVPEGANISKEL